MYESGVEPSHQQAGALWKTFGFSNTFPQECKETFSLPSSRVHLPSPDTIILTKLILLYLVEMAGVEPASRQDKSSRCTGLAHLIHGEIKNEQKSHRDVFQLQSSEPENNAHYYGLMVDAFITLSNRRVEDGSGFTRELELLVGVRKHPSLLLQKFLHVMMHQVF